MYYEWERITNLLIYDFSYLKAVLRGVTHISPESYNSYS